MKNPHHSIRLAVSGMQGSFSEEAALKYSKEQGLKDPQIVYQADMEGALTTFNNNEAELCVIPVYNKIQGSVIPAEKAMEKAKKRGHTFTTAGKVRLSIVFCLLAKKGIQKKDITTIAYYQVAANQCGNFFKNNFPDAKHNPRQDSALAAEELSKGLLSDSTAVIAPKRCVEIYPGLQILAENIQDAPDNFTDFIIVKK